MSSVDLLFMSSLVQIVDTALASATLRSGRHLVCRAGCTQCCHGVFPISHQDADRLRRGLELLTVSDPARANGLRIRVAESLSRLSLGFPGDPTTGIVAEEEEASEAFEDFANEEPCPVLDPATGTCDLYQHRPILCRTFGPPARTEDGNLATCELCYTGASTEEIAGSELDPTLPTVIAASDDAFNAAHHLTGEVLIAYALSNCE
jgi:Fe-S-cluster containining protein